MLKLIRQSYQTGLFISRRCNLPVRNVSLICLPASNIGNKNITAHITATHNLIIHRHKSKAKSSSKQKQVDSDSGPSETDYDSEVIDKNTKILTINVNSLRVDGILKNALGIARNKVETLFYESKIRVNGEKIPKKSVSIKEGDEIDVIKGLNQNNPDMLVVARVEVLSATPSEDIIKLKIRRCKSLIIENYEDRWHGNE